MSVRIPDDEQARLEALREYRILDTPAEDSFDDIARLARRVCGTPSGLVTLIDERRQWFKSHVGFDYEQTDRRDAFCAHTILQQQPLVIEDALRDERFAANPLVTASPHLRFYAGAPIVDAGGHALGTVAVVDFAPQTLGAEQIQGLQELARQAMALLSLRRMALEQGEVARTQSAERERSERHYRRLFEALPTPVWVFDDESLRFLAVNPAAVRHYGWTEHEFLAMTVHEIRPPQEIDRLDAVIDTSNDRLRDLGVWTHRRKDGGLIDVHVRSHRIEFDGRPARLVVANDVTEQLRAQIRIQRQNRMLSVLSGINGLIVRVGDRTTLFDGACAIAVDQGGAAAAWIGWIEADGERIEPVACAGESAFCDALAPLSLTPGDDDTALARAIREREPVVVADLSAEPARVGHNLAAGHGFGSMVAMPLLTAGQARGVMALYSHERGAFDREEMALLTELTEDVAFAITHIETEERARFLAHYDPLTGLANRALLLEMLQPELDAARQRGDGVGLVVLDIDRFRQVNQSLGRAGADAVLREVADRLRALTADHCHVARLGADRFALAGCNVSDAEQVRGLLQQRVLAALEAPLRVQRRELHLSAKAGVALCTSEDTRADGLLAKAEAALRDAKRSGETVVFHTPEISTRLTESLALESRLRVGIGRGELTLHYQPRVTTVEGVLTGAEALMRWNAPDEGLVFPDRFIAVMEETGLILDAGRWAMECVVRDCRDWFELGLAPPHVALNVSVLQLREPHFVDEIAALAGRLVQLGSALEIELTESVLMENVEASVRTLSAVREAGVQVAVDDFGTGFSSLSYLARLPVDLIKIDRSFVLQALEDDYCRTIVTTVITLAHTLGLRVVAEGVETEALAAFLESMGCDELQGYLVARPMPPEHMDTILAPDWRGRRRGEAPLPP